MKIIQIIVLKLVSALVLLLGIVLIASLFTEGYPLIDQAFVEYQSWPEFVRNAAWIIAGVALVFIGFIGLMPWGRRKRVRQVSFAGPHGEVFYDLNSVEDTINRVVGRMPEVKSIASHVAPADERRVEVSAEVILNPTGMGARDAASLVSRQIERAAEQMLGEDGVTKVVLRVKKILVDLKAPLSLPATEPAPAPAPAPASPYDAEQEIQGLEEAERQAREERAEMEAKARREGAEREARPAAGPIAAAAGSAIPMTEEFEERREEAEDFAESTGADYAAPTTPPSADWIEPVRPGRSLEPTEEPELSVEPNAERAGLISDEDRYTFLPEDEEAPRPESEREGVGLLPDEGEDEPMLPPLDDIAHTDEEERERQ